MVNLFPRDTAAVAASDCLGSWAFNDSICEAQFSAFGVGQQYLAIFVSANTELELLSHPGMTDEEIAEIDQLLTSVVIFSLASRLAHLAGYLRRQHRIKTPDSVIAATALLTRTTLVTRNIQDFGHIDNLALLAI